MQEQGGGGGGGGGIAVGEDAVLAEEAEVN
jgi:hypothetical protein